MHEIEFPLIVTIFGVFITMDAPLRVHKEKAHEGLLLYLFYQ